MMKTRILTRVLIIHPGATDFDDQGRIKGSLDMPLSQVGEDQVKALSADLAAVELKTIYAAPCESAKQTAEQLAVGRDAKVKVIESFQNIDQGLWHGKLIGEFKRNHPRVYRTGVESPNELTPPEGEAFRDVESRVSKSLKKCVRKSNGGVVAIIVPDPLATVMRSLLTGSDFRDLWKSQTDDGQWSMIESDRY